jgi:hypothetical protein
MAQDPIYKPRGITIESQGGLNLSNVQESVRASQRLQGRLNQLSDLAFSKMKEKAIREGKQYGVENRPSVEQLADAVYNKTDVNELLANPDTEFGKAAREVQVAQLYQDLINQYKVNANGVLKSVKSRELRDTEEVRQILNANKEGFAKVLDQLDPDYGLKFRASSSTIGFDVVDKADTYIQAETKAKIRSDIDEQTKIAAETYTNIIERDPNPVVVESIMSIHDSDLLSLIEQDPENATKHRENYKNLKRESLFNAIGNHIISNGLYKDAMKGKFGEYEALLRVEEEYTTGTIKDLQKHINEMYDVINTTQKNATDNNNRLLDEQATPLFIEYDEGEKTYEQLIQDLTNIGYEVSPKLKRDLKSKETASEAQEDKANDLELRINLDLAGPDDIDDAYKKNEITRKDKNKLKQSYIKNVKNLNNGNKIIYKEFKVDEADIRMLDRNNPLKSLIAEAQLRLQREQTEVLSAGNVFNQREAAHRISQEVVAEYVQGKVPQVFKKVKRTLDSYQNAPQDLKAFLSMTEDEIKNLITKRGQLIVDVSSAKLIDYQRKLKAYEKGIIPDDDE